MASWHTPESRLTGMRSVIEWKSPSLSIAPGGGRSFMDCSRQTNSNPFPKVLTFLPTPTQKHTKLLNRGKNEDIQTDLPLSGLLSTGFSLFFS